MLRETNKRTKVFCWIRVLRTTIESIFCSNIHRTVVRNEQNEFCSKRRQRRLTWVNPSFRETLFLLNLFFVDRESLTLTTTTLLLLYSSLCFSRVFFHLFVPEVLPDKKEKRKRKLSTLNVEHNTTLKWVGFLDWRTFASPKNNEWWWCHHRLLFSLLISRGRWLHAPLDLAPPKTVFISLSFQCLCHAKQGGAWLTLQTQRDTCNFLDHVILLLHNLCWSFWWSFINDVDAKQGV